MKIIAWKSHSTSLKCVLGERETSLVSNSHLLFRFKRFRSRLNTSVKSRLRADNVTKKILVITSNCSQGFDLQGFPDADRHILNDFSQFRPAALFKRVKVLQEEFEERSLIWLKPVTRQTISHKKLLRILSVRPTEARQKSLLAWPGKFHFVFLVLLLRDFDCASNEQRENETNGGNSQIYRHFIFIWIFH